MNVLNDAEQLGDGPCARVDGSCSATHYASVPLEVGFRDKRTGRASPAKGERAMRMMRCPVAA